MKTAFLCSLTLLLAASTTFTQPDTLWTRTFGGSGIDAGSSVQQTNDGGYIIAGFTSSYGAGSLDVWMIKTNDNGIEQWTRTFGGSLSDKGYSVQQTTDGGYVIAGYTRSYGAGGSDVWLIKTNSNGDSLWSRTFGGSSSESSYSVQQTADGGYIIVGDTYPADVWLIKTDTSGNELWNRTFEEIHPQHGYDVRQTNDGGYIIAGDNYFHGAGGIDVWLIKTDDNGDNLWSHTFGGSDNECSYSVQQTSDGEYILVGYTESYGAGNFDIWLIKTDVNGDSLWSRTFGGNSHDIGLSVQRTVDGGFIVAGATSSYGAGNFDIWLIKTDDTGNQLWNRTFGGSDWDGGWAVQQINDGGYIIVGETYSYGAGESDVWLIRLDSETSIEIDPDLYIPSKFTLYPPYPNPFNPKTTINYEVPINSQIYIEIFNILGQKVATLFDGMQQPGHHTITWNATDASSGIYFCRMQANSFTQIQKLVLLR